MIILISGGTNNGKSYHAKQISKYLSVKNNLSLYYVATAEPANQEQAMRIEASKKDREGLGFTTVEQTTDIEKAYGSITANGVLLINNITALLANEIFVKDQISGYKEQKVIDGLKQLFTNYGSYFVIISDYMFSNSVTYDESTDNFCRALGRINMEIAKTADVVIEVCYSNLVYHKGEQLLTEYHSA